MRTAGPARGRARPYSCFVLERRNSAIMLPKLYIVPLDELPGIFHRGLIVGAHKSNCSADKTVFVHDVSSILGHIGVTPKSLRTTSIPSRLSGSGFRNPDVRTRRSQGAHRAASRKKVRPRISPRPYPIGMGYIRPCLSIFTLCHADRRCQRIATATNRRRAVMQHRRAPPR